MFALKTNKARGTAIAAATALIAAGIVGVTSSAAEAATATYAIAPAVAGGTATTVVTITGKGDFKNAAGASQVMVDPRTVNLDLSYGLKVATNCGTSALTVAGEVNTWNTTPNPDVITNGVLSYSVVSSTKITATIVSPGVTANTKTDWKLCVYSKASGNPLLGSGTLSAYPAPTVTKVNDQDTSSTAYGPTYGGQAITVEGNYFTKNSTVKVGGVAATNVKFIDANTLTAVTPALSGASLANLNVQVTTEGGSSAAWNHYTYERTVQVSPNSGAAAAGSTITVHGIGFTTTTNGWGTDTTSHVGGQAAGAYVIFMDGNTVFSSGETTAAGNGNVQQAPTAICTNVAVVSDTELTCETPALTAGKVYTVQVVDDAQLQGWAVSNAATKAAAALVSKASTVSYSSVYAATDF